MELRHLRYFVAVAELGSVSRAAEKLFIAQPPLTTQIKQLEDEIGTPLFVRYPRGVRLTPAGSRFLTEAKDLLARAERAKRLALQADDALGGLVQIGFVPSASHTVLARLLRALKTSLPQLEVTVQEMVTSAQVVALQERQIDIGIGRPSATTRKQISIGTEMDDPFCLALPQDHPLAALSAIELPTVANEAFVFFTRQVGPAYFDQIIGLCTDCGFSPQIRFEASTIYGVLDLVSAGLGLAIVPASATVLFTQHVVFRPILKPTRPCSMALLHRKGDNDPLLPLLVASTRAVFEKLAGEITIAIGR
ncbi:MAG: LysR family transcriptional regulator [Rhodoferax sp.]|uniref:LysR family transcriptional regulator n=1 Tax=Rhodoferax sp. TaxID=50421 RepID=UPI0032678816